MTRKPPSETSASDANSRRSRLVARRSRRTRITVGIVAAVLAGGLAVGAYALNSKSSAAQTSSPSATKPAQFGENTLVSPAAAKTPAPRSLDHAHPLKLWVGGDSLAGSFGPALGDQVGATGVVQTVIDYKVSSGLWSNDIRNWDERVTEQMAADNPDAVVFIIGTNDTPVVNQVDANNDGVLDWAAVYQVKVAHMMDLLVGPNHRTVFWLGPPTLGTRSLDRGAQLMGEVMRKEAAKRPQDVVYLDTYKLFSTPDGSYSRHILDENGNEITARIADGTHFSQDGAAYLARAVFTLINTRWKLLKQADPADPIGWSFADGTGESVPGYKSRPTSRYHPSRNQSTGTSSPSVTDTTGASVTTTPVTVAPTTTPVVTTPTTVAVTPTTTRTTGTTAPTTPTTPTPTRTGT